MECETAVQEGGCGAGAMEVQGGMMRGTGAVRDWYGVGFRRISKAQAEIGLRS